MKRYARQISIAGVGERGQARLASAAITVDGSGLDAEVCALYLAGAGVGRLSVAASIAERCREQNSEVIVARDAASGVCRVRVGAELHEPSLELSQIERGARAARWALSKVLE